MITAMKYSRSLIMLLCFLFAPWWINTTMALMPLMPTTSAPVPSVTATPAPQLTTATPAAETVATAPTAVPPSAAMPPAESAIASMPEFSTPLQPATPTESSTTTPVTPSKPEQQQPATPQPALPPQNGVMPSTTINVGDLVPQETQDDANIYLNFDNASLGSVLNYLSEQKKFNIIPHKDLETAKVSLTTRNPLTLERAWNVMLTLLEMNGFTIVKVGALHRVVPSQNNGQEPLPVYSSGTGTEPENLPDSDLVVRYVYFLKNIKVDAAHSILSKMIDEKNIVDNKDLNVCIIKDQCLNIKAAMKIVKELDDGGLREAIEVISLTWANADDIQKLFTDIVGEKDEKIIRFSSFQSKEASYFSSATKILAEPTQNSLILLGTKKNIEKIKGFIYKYLDVPIESADSRLHVKELRYVRAQDIQPILVDIIKPPKGTTEKALVMEGGYKVFEDVVISAEQDDTAGSETAKRGGGNRLIIACNREDWKRLETFIDKLDKPQPQVAIEVMIVDVNMQNDRSLGVQMFNVKGNPLAHNVNVEFQNLTSGIAKSGTEESKNPFSNPYIDFLDPANQLIGNEHGSYFTLGRADPRTNQNIWSIIKATLNIKNSQVISQPYVIANNNQKCTVSVKTTFRVSGKVDTKNIQPVVQKEDLDAEIKIDLTPTINLTGTIDLSTDISVDEFQQVNPSDTASKSTRKLVTKACLGAGEVLVLGGLTKSKLTDDVYKTPILGDIPILGNLFKTKAKSKTEENLYVFIRPSIIKPRFEGAPDEYTQLKLDYAKYQIMKNDMYIHDRDPIQRWFFRPSHQTIKQKLSDAAQGVLRPIDDYTYGRNRPKSANLQEDPYFKVSEAIEKARLKREAEKQKQAAHYAPVQGPIGIAQREKEPLEAVSA